MLTRRKQTTNQIRLKMPESAFAVALQLTLIELFGDIALKMQKPIIGFTLYNVLAYVLYMKLPKQNLALVNAYWDALSNIATTLAGVIVFKEKYNACQWTGFVMITLGVALLHGGEMSNNKK